MGAVLAQVTTGGWPTYSKLSKPRAAPSERRVMLPPTASGEARPSWAPGLTVIVPEPKARLAPAPVRPTSETNAPSLTVIGWA